MCVLDNRDNWDNQFCIYIRKIEVFMFIEAIPKSISPAIPGWWARFKDDDCGEWWSPVAAWEICDVFYSGDSETYSEILPVLTGDNGMTPHHSAEGYCECLYLSDTKFILSDEPGTLAWHPADNTAEQVTTINVKTGEQTA